MTVSKVIIFYFGSFLKYLSEKLCYLNQNVEVRPNSLDEPSAYLNIYFFLIFIGWTGEQCATQISFCDSSPCENNGECVDLFQDYFCVCPKGTDGKHCETAPERCIGSPCMNGGACRDYGSGLNCSCSDAYTGIGCQYEYDACAQNACQNGATCIDNGGPDYECVCPEGYVGKNCEGKCEAFRKIYHISLKNVPP